MKITCLVLYIFALALIMGPCNDISEYWILHSYTRKSTDICCCWFIIFVAESMWISIVCWFKTKRSRISVHFLEEIFHRLVWLKTTLIFIHWSSSTTINCPTWILLLICVYLWVVIGVILILFVALKPGGNFKKILPKVFCKGHCSIIATG